MGIAENITARKQRERDQQLAEHHAELFVTAMLAGWADTFKMLSPLAKKAVAKLLHDRYADRLHLPCSPAGIAAENVRKDELRKERGEAALRAVELAIEQAKRIIELCEELPDRAEPFRSNVAEACEDMLQTIKSRWDVTDAQQTALDNWEEGVGRWIR